MKLRVNNQMYLNGEPGPQASSYAAPTRATDLAGLPPAYVCVGVEDLFRDEDIDYARRLMAADVPCELALFPGVYHAAEVFTPDAVVSKRLNAICLRNVKWYLVKEGSNGKLIYKLTDTLTVQNLFAELSD